MPIKIRNSLVHVESERVWLASHLSSVGILITGGQEFGSERAKHWGLNHISWQLIPVLYCSGKEWFVVILFRWAGNHVHLIVQVTRESSHSGSYELAAINCYQAIVYFVHHDYSLLFPSFLLGCPVHYAEHVTRAHAWCVLVAYLFFTYLAALCWTLKAFLFYWC